MTFPTLLLKPIVGETSPLSHNPAPRRAESDTERLFNAYGMQLLIQDEIAEKLPVIPSGYSNAFSLGYSNSCGIPNSQANQFHP